MSVELNRPVCSPGDLERVARVLSATSITSGEPVRELEQSFAARLGAAACVAVTSGTAALEAALVGVGVGPGDEVLTSGLTAASTLHAILRAGGTPGVVDIDPETGLVDLDRLEQAITRRTKVLLPVHLHGQMVDMVRVRAIADRHKLRIVEEASHAIEGSRDGVAPGELADAASFNFFTSSTLSCGKGGAVITGDLAMAARLRRRRQHGMAPRDRKEIVRKGAPPYDVLEVGAEEDLDDLRAVLLLAQFGRLDAAWERRERIAERYDAVFRDTSQIWSPAPVPGSRHARQAYPLRARRRQPLRQHLKQQGIASGLHVPVVTRLSFYREYYSDLELPLATAFGDETLLLPIHDAMSDDDVERVIEAVLAGARKR